jgi:PGF-CTERM protein
MTGTLRRALAALVALTVVGAGAIGAVAAASNGSLSASPAAAGETSTHTATVTVGDAATGSWNGLAVDYAAAGADVSEVGSEDIATVGIDRGDDSSGDTIDVNVADDLSDVTASNNGETLTLKFGGSYELNAGDEVVVVYEGVENPDAGEYTVPLDVNPQSSGGEAEATLAVGSGDDSTTTAADGGDDTTTAADGDDGADNEADDGGSSGGSVPGFGAGAALAAVLGAALLALRN